MEVAVVLVGVAHLVRDDATEHVGRAARIVEERVRFVSEWKRRREPRHVLLALTEEHLDDVAHLADFVVLDEREPVTHRQKVLQPYGVTRVVGVGHSCTGARASGSSRPSSTSVPRIMCRCDLAIDHDSS